MADCLLKMVLKLAPALLLIVSFTSIIIGIILHGISIDEVKFHSTDQRPHQFEPNIIIGDKPNDLVWFLQVTDLHLSNRGNFERQRDFNKFTKDYVDIIKPEVVLITGDITDGRVPNTTFNSGPQLEEWKAYNSAIVNSGNLNKTIWLDIRGNHDNFNVYRPKDPNTLFRKYSIQGRNYARNYMYIHEKDGKNYTFIGVDEVQTPGLKIPFNFIGLVDKQDLTELEGFKKKAIQANSQSNVWFAHYPTSSVASPNGGLRDIVDGPYLCGHFHTISNLVTQMHSTQQPGYAEIELGDWKYNRLIRLAAIDHQLFNFVDVKFEQFPIALVTNPKKVKYSMPKYEPIERIMNSTHIRVIAFSNVTITKVQISIDGGDKKDMKNSAGPLYVLDWNTQDYKQGLHSLRVFVADSEGKEQEFEQKFSFDMSKDDFSLGGRILIRGCFRSNVMTLYFFVVIVLTLPILCLRIITNNKRESGHETTIKRHYRGTFLYKLQILSSIDRLFWPLFIIPIWLSVGPNFLSYMVDEALGACFVWGILIDGAFLYTGITFNVGSIFLLLIHVPVTILLVNQVSDNYKLFDRLNSNVAASVINLKFITHIALTALQVWMGYMLMSAYGILAFVTSFPFFHCIVIYAYCWYQCTKLEKTSFLRFNGGPNSHEEHRALTSQSKRDDKSSTSDHSAC